MPIKKRKPKVSSKRYEMDITRTDPRDVAKFADTPEGKESPFFAAQDSQGVTLGRRPDYREYEGKALPEWKETRQLFVELNLNFVVRVTCDREGITYLEIHQAGQQSFYSFPFKGIEYQDLFSIVPDFEQRLSRFLINYGMYPLFWALYRAKESNKKDRSKAYEKITKNFEIFFKNILKPKRLREIESKEIGGLKVIAYERIEAGREPKTIAEIEQEKNKFISDVFETFKALDQNGRKRTQYTVAMEIFDGESNPDRKELEKAIGNRLRKFGLTWNQLQTDYEKKTPK